MMENTIITYNGEVALKKNCRYIKGEFYIKNKQCFDIDGTWYRINSGLIAKDYETGEYKIIKGSTMINGIIGYKKKTEEIVTGYFTPNKFRNVSVVINGSRISCLNEELLENDFIINLKDLQYYPKGTSVAKSVNNAFCLSDNIYGSLPYNVRNIPEERLTLIHKYAHDRLDKHVPGEFICLGSTKNLPSFTYGLEFETNSGAIPEHHLSNGGLIPLRDGSIRGFEYATIPYSSSDIGSAVSLACKTLSTYTRISANESLHLHIGNIPNINEHLIGVLYTVCCLLEDEIYSMFPKFYIETSKFKSKGKDYNKGLVKAFVDNDPKVTFQNIATYLAAGKRFTGFGSKHPLDPDGNHKWQVETRYHWCNFINLLFGNSKTIEFRIHTPSTNPYKIMNWIYITSAIVKYAVKVSRAIENKTMVLSDIKKVSLKDIMESEYSSYLALHLNKYISYRKAKRIECDSLGDFVGETEAKNDLSYSIDFKG